MIQDIEPGQKHYKHNIFTGTKSDPINRIYEARKLDAMKTVRSTSGNKRVFDVTSLSAPFLGLEENNSENLSVFFTIVRTNSHESSLAKRLSGRSNHGNTNHTVYETLFVLLLSKYDVIDPSEIRGRLRKSTDPPGRFCKTGQFAMFEALCFSG